MRWGLIRIGAAPVSPHERQRMDERNRATVILVLLVFFAASLGGKRSFAAESPFFKGKTIRFVIGTSPGGGHDIHVRTLAKELGKFVPGQPRVIVQNMTGGGGVVAGNYIYKVAKPDGLSIGFFPGGNILLDLIGQTGVEFSSRKFQWIGTASTAVATCFARRDAGVKTISDAIGSPKPFILGSSGRGTTMSIHPRALNEVLGTNFEVIEGYRGAAEVYAALERGEVSGVCGLFWSSIQTARPDWVSKGYINVFLQLGLDKHSELKEVPWVMDLVKKPQDRQFLEALFAPLRMARPFFVHPEVEPERVKILREAFMGVLTNASFLKQAERMRLEISPSSGEEVQSLVEKVFASPPAVVKAIAALLGP
jgi:tripartite-type tricarboxylate transporter receptor subunit TctC